MGPRIWGIELQDASSMDMRKNPKLVYILDNFKLKAKKKTNWKSGTAVDNIKF